MRRPYLPILLASALLGGGLAPAGLVTGALSEACAGRCRFADSTGYWWNGSSNVYLRDAGPEEHWRSLGRLTWAFDGPGLRLTLGQGQNHGQARLSVGRDGLHIELDRLALPAASVLGRLGHGLPREGWDGRLIANEVRLDLPWPLRALHGQGDLLWQQARTSLLESYPLGDYRLHWTLSPESRWQGQVQGGTGLRLNGEAEAAPFRFNGTAELDAEAGALKKYLLTFGRPEGENSYRLELPGAANPG